MIARLQSEIRSPCTCTPSSIDRHPISTDCERRGDIRILTYAYFVCPLIQLLAASHSYFIMKDFIRTFGLHGNVCCEMCMLTDKHRHQ